MTVFYTIVMGLLHILVTLGEGLITFAAVYVVFWLFYCLLVKGAIPIHISSAGKDLVDTIRTKPVATKTTKVKPVATKGVDKPVKPKVTKVKPVATKVLKPKPVKPTTQPAPKRKPAMPLGKT